MPQTAGGGSLEPAKPLTNNVPSDGTQIAKVEVPLPVVDYIVASPARGPKPPENRPQALVLQGKRLRFRIHLPLGSVAGDYEVRLHRKADKKEVLRAQRSAAKENRFTLADDFAKFPPVSISSRFSPWMEGRSPGLPSENCQYRPKLRVL